MKYIEKSFLLTTILFISLNTIVNAQIREYNDGQGNRAKKENSEVPIIANAADGSVVKENLRMNTATTPDAENERIWTFDCSQQGWGEYVHTKSFTLIHKLASPALNSGHIELHTPPGQTQGWLFGPGEAIDADVYKYIHFSLVLENADELPDEGIGALFVFANDSAHDIITPAVPFTVFKGQNYYTIDLTEDTRWTGTKYIDRFHFPSGTPEEYNPETATFRLDWISLSDIPNIVEPLQDTTSACALIEPVISSEIETVVFCNRASVKAHYSGNRSLTEFKVWKENSTDTIIQSRVIFNDGYMYFSVCDLDLNTNYKFQITTANTAGSFTSDIGRFTTENERAEEQPSNYWMTPSPFKLIQNANDNLLDDDSWPDAGHLAQVFKIHGATYHGGISSEFYKYDLPKLIYTINKYRMRLAFERVVGGNESGEEYAEEIFRRIEEIASYGGKMEFITWDGMLLHCYNSHQTKENFRSIEEGIEAVAEATRIVKDRYPEFEIIPLPNLPNWSVRDSEGNVVLYNAGNKAEQVGVNTWMDLADRYFSKLNEKGVSIHRIEIDHPYYYYYKENGREQSRDRIKAMKDYCAEHNLELIIIVNQSRVGSGDTDSQDAAFKKGCLNYLQDLREDGLNPEHIDVESWYRWPQYLVPETRENSYTNIIRDVGKVFLLSGKIRITTEAGVNEISGYGVQLPLYAKKVDDDSDFPVEWTVNDERVATIDKNGILTSVKWGTVVVTATAKNGSGWYAEFILKILDPEEPEEIRIQNVGKKDTINGLGNTIKFFAFNAENGDTLDVIWSVDNIRAGSIDGEGVLTTLRTGSLNVIARLKSNPEKSASFQIYVTNNSTGVIAKQRFNNINVYPNPASQTVYINIGNDYENVVYRLFDLTGKNVRITGTLQSGVNCLSLKTLSDGVYFMQVSSGQNVRVEKIIKKSLNNKF